MIETWFLAFGGSPLALFQALEPTPASACTLFVLASHPSSQLGPLDGCSSPLRGCGQRGRCLGLALSQGSLGFQATTLSCPRIRVPNGDFVAVVSLLSQDARSLYQALWRLYHPDCDHDTSKLLRCEG